jgi:hypothetical protein
VNDVSGKMKVIEARLSALTNAQSTALKLHSTPLPAVESQLPSQLGLLATGPPPGFTGGALVHRVIAEQH